MALFITLISIFYQDLKERAVWWFLFPCFSLLAGFLYFIKTIGYFYLLNVLTNILILTVIMSIAYLYSKFKMKLNFKEVFGLGDILFFVGLCGAFPIISFIVLFVSSLIFSLVIHFLLSRQNDSTVPLAGFSSMLLLFIYLIDWLAIYKNLYFN